MCRALRAAAAAVHTPGPVAAMVGKARPFRGQTAAPRSCVPCALLSACGTPPGPTLTRSLVTRAQTPALPSRGLGGERGAGLQRLNAESAAAGESKCAGEQTRRLCPDSQWAPAAVWPTWGRLVGDERQGSGGRPSPRAWAPAPGRGAWPVRPPEPRLSLPADHQPDGAGELDHRHPLRLLRRRGAAPPQGGHATPAQVGDQEAGAEDRHGREDEEDGRDAALLRHRLQEEEDHPGPGARRAALRARGVLRWSAAPCRLPACAVSAGSRQLTGPCWTAGSQRLAGPRPVCLWFPQTRGLGWEGAGGGGHCRPPWIYGCGSLGKSHRPCDIQAPLPEKLGVPLAPPSGESHTHTQTCGA